MLTAVECSPLVARPEMPTVRLAVERLTVTDFRCYAQARLDVTASAVVLSGPNGAGKTNLLEAVSLLAPGRGLRGARPDDLPRCLPGASPVAAWAVAAQFHTPDGPLRVGTGRSNESERRQVRVDGRAVRSHAELAGRMPMVWLTPAMDRVFQEGPGGRRRLLDRIVFGLDPAHAGRVAAYDHALRERAKLLRTGHTDPTWLAALEETMAGHGVAIVAARREAATRLAQVSIEDLTPFPGADLAVVGAVEDWLDGGPALAVEERFRDALMASRQVDAETGGAAVGPHKSDLAVTQRPSGRPASLCSTGEQKALLIALVLAAARAQTTSRGVAPLLLLDEVAAHLDADRREALFVATDRLGVQAWFTGTDRAAFSSLAGQADFFTVRDAEVVRDETTQGAATRWPMT